MNLNVIHDTVRRASIALAAELVRRTGSNLVRAMHGDALPIGSVPLQIQDSIGDVDLSPIGLAYYQAETHKLAETCTWLARNAGNANVTRDAMRQLYVGADTRAIQRMHQFAPLVHVAYHYCARVAGRMNWDGDKKQLIVRASKLEMRIDTHRLECNGYVRRASLPVPKPELILSQSAGHTTRTAPNLGAIYRAVAMELPELATATRLLVTVAFLVDMPELVTDQFDIDRCNQVAENRGAWSKAYDAVVKSKDMPWKVLHTLLRNLVEPHEFRQAFNTEISWVNLPYQAHQRERHMAALLAMQNRDLYRQKFTPTEIEERQHALRIFQFQQKVR